MNESGDAYWSGYRAASRDPGSYAYATDDDGEVVEIEVVFPSSYRPGRRTKVMAEIKQALVTAVRRSSED